MDNYYKQKIDSIKTFDYKLDYKNLDLRKNPELYKIGIGEQGVLLVQPYKSEILPFRRFKTPEIAIESSNKIYELFLEYIKNNDFVGADMARKFLQMGYTRSRRYANHSSGQKYESNPQDKSNAIDEKKARKKILPQSEDRENGPKAKSAKIFYKKYELAKNNLKYIQMKKDFKDKRYGAII